MIRIPAASTTGPTSETPLSQAGLASLADDIRRWGRELGFQQVGIASVDLGEHGSHLTRWLERGFQGDMDYMSAHGEKRSQPALLVPGTQRIISVRMDYLPEDPQAWETLKAGELAYISRYALGRDYHKLIRRRLQQLADRIVGAAGEVGYRAFVDSAPVLEKAVAEQAGLGWIGKHTLVINRSAGSFFFLGELFTNLPLPVDAPVSAHCGSCSACIDICPTRAIVGPYQLDARRCISYLTIESRAPIPLELRPLMGNRVFGCDDCQLACPWNRYARASGEGDFSPRHALDRARLLDLFLWTEAEFLSRTEGSAIRRTGYQGWQRNLAVGLGNAPYDPAIVAALEQRRAEADAMVAEHIDWALARQQAAQGDR
jgi:epoxyqueuosine reductase